VEGDGLNNSGVNPTFHPASKPKIGGNGEPQKNDECDDGNENDETSTKIALFMPTTATRIDDENFRSSTP
jgi:hypothetical protein